ncbi:MAG: hypothetical protein ABI877_14960, partial [Gemmatimonadaceae bacterium]
MCNDFARRLHAGFALTLVLIAPMGLSGQSARVVPLDPQNAAGRLPQLDPLEASGRLLQLDPQDAFGGLLHIDRGIAGLRQRLLELRTTASVMQTTAHPDDEQS